MKKLYLLVLRTYAGPAFATFFIVIFVLLMQFVWKYVDELVGKGLEWHVIARLLYYASYTFVPLALPISILLSSIMAFGNLGEHFELVAIKSAGISMRKIFLPIGVLALFMSIGAFYYYNNAYPYANLKFRSTLYDVREKKLALNIKEGIFYSGLEGYVIKIGKKEMGGSVIKDVMIYDHTQRQGNNKLILADSGIMQQTGDKNFMLITLFDGINYEESVDSREKDELPFKQMSFKREQIKFDLSQFQMSSTDEELFKSSYTMLNSKQLIHISDSLSKDIKVRINDTYRVIIYNFPFLQKALIGDSMFCEKKSDSSSFELFEKSLKPKTEFAGKAIDNVRSTQNSLNYTQKVIEDKNVRKARHDIEFHRKITLSLACLILFLIGAPLGAIVRKGGFGLPLVLSVLLFLIYHIVSFTGEKIVASLVVDAWVGMWLSTVLFLPVGLMLTYYAVNDSNIMNSETYKQFFERIMDFFKQKKRKIS